MCCRLDNTLTSLSTYGKNKLHDYSIFSYQLLWEKLWFCPAGSSPSCSHSWRLFWWGFSSLHNTVHPVCLWPAGRHHTYHDCPDRPVLRSFSEDVVEREIWRRQGTNLKDFSIWSFAESTQFFKFTEEPGCLRFKQPFLGSARWSAKISLFAQVKGSPQQPNIKNYSKSTLPYWRVVGVHAETLQK